jgi:hypothetical protein
MQQQIRRAAVSREKREAAMAVFGRLWQEEPAPLTSTNSVTTYGHTALAVSLAHSGDGAGADAVIEALTDGADRLYPVSYNTTAAYTAFAEIYLSHSVLPDGTGLADFEERIAVPWSRRRCPDTGVWTSSSTMWASAGRARWWMWKKRIGIPFWM